MSLGAFLKGLRLCDRGATCTSGTWTENDGGVRYTQDIGRLTLILCGGTGPR
jgi:hypothetical protein